MRKTPHSPAETPPLSPARRKSFRRRAAAAAWILLSVALFWYVVGNLTVLCGSRGITDRPEDLPKCRTALVLGCSPNIGSRRNLFFLRRMEAAAALYRSGKAETLLLSGDNGSRGYNEPEAMRRHLIALGVPDEAIYCDYAGFRTLDSVVRACDVFQQRRFIIVSQKFHCRRAVFLARMKGAEAFGFAAEDIGAWRWKFRNHFRESLARPAALLDLLTARQPRFRGETVDMTAPQHKAD